MAFNGGLLLFNFLILQPGDTWGEAENTRPLEAYVEDVRRRESESNGCKNTDLTL